MKTKSNIPNSLAHGQGAGSASLATATTHGAPSNGSSEFHNFFADIEDLIKATTSLTGEDLVQATAKLSERVAEAKESVEEMSVEIANQARKTAAGTNDYVHKQPWEAIGAGAAVAFLLGFVLARRS
jgi:ElaB/YqjD/DUF883 family membrane-anchored ribosome-binding protein